MDPTLVDGVLEEDAGPQDDGNRPTQVSHLPPRISSKVNLASSLGPCESSPSRTAARDYITEK